MSATDADAAVAMRWIDDHCHVHFGRADRDAIAEAITAAHGSGVERLITVGCDVNDSHAAIAVARDHADVWATAGVHPHEAAGGVEGLEALLGEAEVVAVGECGLDYHYDNSPRDAQRQVFAEQIAMANRHDLALMIHTREAWSDTFDILAVEGVPERTVFHCFTGGPKDARRCLDLGAHLSFSGIVTFKTADDVRSAATVCPADRLLVETDAPYLAPVPHRGEQNRPALVPVVGAALAAVRGEDVASVARTTWANASRVYRLG